jgi:UDP-N-acetylglucosamine/UDP-N-acetyl-alpha-D-glucosaminouronate 4-epimerase
MRFLVTGAAGFIGSHLCLRLVAEGHDVVGFDDLSDGHIENLAHVPEVRLERADLRDPIAVSAAARGCDVILHQAAMKSVPRSIEEPERYTDVNVLGTLHVLLAARDEGAVVVSASSSSVYGDQEHFPVTEEMAPRPRSPYAASKLATEGFCRAWWTSYGVPTISLRYLNVYGPGQDPTDEYASVVPRFVTACLEGTRPVIHGDGEQARDFTFVEDVVEANLLAARMPEAARGAVLNIGGGRPATSVNELLAIIAGLTGTSPDPIHEPVRSGDIRRSEADIGLARLLLGYDPQVDAREGLRRTLDAFREGSGRAEAV